MPLARKTKVRHTAIAHMSVNDMGSPLAASSPTTSVVTKATMIANFKNSLEDYYRQKLDKLEMMKGLTLALLDRNGIGDVVYSDCNAVEQPFHTSVYQNMLIALKNNCPGYEHLQTLEICREMPPPPGTTVVKKRVTRATMKSSNRSSSEDSANKTTRKRKNSAQTVLRTPTSRGRPYQVAAVTPGCRLQTPSVYRKPCAGEQVISMSGSPILVPTENMANNVPQMHIPMADGRVFAVMPQGLVDDMPDFPDIDAETKKQLKMLRQYLEKKILD